MMQAQKYNGSLQGSLATASTGTEASNIIKATVSIAIRSANQPVNLSLHRQFCPGCQLNVQQIA